MLAADDSLFLCPATRREAHDREFGVQAGLPKLLQIHREANDTPPSAGHVGDPCARKGRRFRTTAGSTGTVDGAFSRYATDIIRSKNADEENCTCHAAHAISKSRTTAMTPTKVPVPSILRYHQVGTRRGSSLDLFGGSP